MAVYNNIGDGSQINPVTGTGPDYSALEAILKVWYKDGVENLLFRNSPVVKSIGKTRVEGKQQNFAALYARGGAVAGNYLLAKTKAATNARNAEFTVKQGQIFAPVSYNVKEVQASMTRRGAYMKIAGNKFFAGTESLRKTLAAAFYGSGFGEIGVIENGGSGYSFTAATPVDITLTSDAVMKIDIDSELVFKATVSTAETSAIATATVSAINGNTVTVIPGAGASSTSIPDGTIIALAGSTDASGNPVLPMGIDGWLPVKALRTGATWTSYIATAFCGVNRSVNADALAGNFVLGTSTEKKVDTVQRLLMACRRRGSEADLIVMNDNDWLAVAAEIQADNTYFTQTSTKSKRKANVGLDSISASFSTNFIDNIVDDPYCPAGKFYILDKSAVEYWSMTNADTFLNDGIAGNNPGKQDVESADNKGKENDPYKLLVDDYITIQPGEGTFDGPSNMVTLQTYGAFVVTNASVCGVGIFYDATRAAETVPYSSILGVV